MDDLESSSRRLVRRVAGADTRLIGQLNVLRRQFLAGRRKSALDEQSTLKVLEELQNALETEAAKLRAEPGR